MRFDRLAFCFGKKNKIDDVGEEGRIEEWVETLSERVLSEQGK